MIIKPSKQQVIGAKKVIDDVKKEIDLVQKNYDNDKVDINPAKGEVEINYNPKSELTKITDGSSYREKVYGARISHDSETGELKDASITTSRQLRGWYPEVRNGSETVEMDRSEVTYSLKETAYKEVTEKGLLGKEKKKEVYTQFEDGRAGEEKFTRIEVDKTTGAVIDIDTSKGNSALKKARKEFSQIDDKRFLINSKDPDFKIGKCTNEELKIAEEVMKRVMNDIELAREYDNVNHSQTVRWVEGEDKDTRPGEIDMPETRFTGENYPSERPGPYMKRLVDKVEMSFDSTTGEVKNAKISTYTRMPQHQDEEAFSLYEEKIDGNGKIVSVYFNREKRFDGSAHTTVEAYKDTGEVLSVKHFNGRDIEEIKKGLKKTTNKLVIGTMAAIGLATTVTIGGGTVGSIVGGLLLGALAGSATGFGVQRFMEKIGEDLVIEHKASQAYPKKYRNQLKTEEKEVKEAAKKAEKEATEAMERVEKEYEISQRDTKANELKFMVDDAKECLVRYDNKKADLNPEKGKVLIDESYSPFNEVSGHGKLKADPETGEIKSAEIMTDRYIYKYEEKGSFLGLGKKKEVYTYYKRDNCGEYYSTATIDKESGEVRNFKEWSGGEVFDIGKNFSLSNFHEQLEKPLEAMKMKHQLKKRSL